MLGGWPCLLDQGSSAGSRGVNVGQSQADTDDTSLAKGALKGKPAAG